MHSSRTRFAGRLNSTVRHQIELAWIFSGPNSSFSTVFSSEQLAVKWIEQGGLSGMLTRYALDTPVIDWAVQSG
ncbi:MAG: DUF7710 domain-containing protein [Stenotrophomonas sp.]